MDFRSDNTACVHPSLFEAMFQTNNATQASYGNDDISKQLKHKLTEIFATEVWPVLVSTGTAANCAALRALTPGHGTIIIANEAHLNNDEGQAPELLLGGAKLRGFSNPDHKLDLIAARTWVHKARAMFPHAGNPTTVSITQTTEWGDIYSMQELREVRAFCDEEKLRLHIDGARITNALAAQNLSLREFYNIVKPDALSFGLTKNGGLMAEAVLVFDAELAIELKLAQKQLGQLLSKTRFIAAQFLALLEDDLYLKLAEQANSRAGELIRILETHKEIEIIGKPKTNQVFAKIPHSIAKKLQNAGVLFYNWEQDSWRFVCSWTTETSEIASFSKLLASI